MIMINLLTCLLTAISRKNVGYTCHFSEFSVGVYAWSGLTTIEKTMCCFWSQKKDKKYRFQWGYLILFVWWLLFWCKSKNSVLYGNIPRNLPRRWHIEERDMSPTKLPPPSLLLASYFILIYTIMMQLLLFDIKRIKFKKQTR